MRPCQSVLVSFAPLAEDVRIVYHVRCVVARFLAFRTRWLSAGTWYTETQLQDGKSLSQRERVSNKPPLADVLGHAFPKLELSLDVLGHQGPKLQLAPSCPGTSRAKDGAGSGCTFASQASSIFGSRCPGTSRTKDLTVSRCN
jgi:hypothetical protein